MVKALFLELLVITMCAFASAVPPQRVRRSLTPVDTDAGYNILPPPPSQQLPLGLPTSSMSPIFFSPSPSNIDDDDPAVAVRSERSTNLSFNTEAARRIQMFIKNRYLQLLPDGTVNGTSDDNSVYTILQRISVGIGKLRIQGVGTCQYLCMDNCGLLYGTREFVDECVFNEMIEQHHYNTYSSTKYSNEKRTLYLALNKRGQSRKVMLRARQRLGRLSSFARILTRVVSPERTEDFHPLRHHGGHMCTSSSTVEPIIYYNHHHHPPFTSNPQTLHLPRCRKRKKRRKKKRKCPSDNDGRGGHMIAPCTKKTHTQTQISHNVEESSSSNNSSSSSNKRNNGSNKCASGNSDECQRVELTEKKRQKTKHGDKSSLHNGGKIKKHPKSSKGKKSLLQAKTALSSTTTSTTTGPTITTSISPSPLEDSSLDEDYAGESTTFLEYEYSTVTDTAVFPQPD